MDQAVLPLAAGFDPQALVVTCGADGLDGDPLSRLALSNVGLWAAVEKLVAVCDRSVVLGGGGYNPWTVVRCWGGLWGRLSGRRIPEVLPPAACTFLRGLQSDLIDEDEVPERWLSHLEDLPNTGPVRKEVERLPACVLH